MLFFWASKKFNVNWTCTSKIWEMYFDDWSSHTRILGFDDIACYYFNSLDLDSTEDKIFYEKEKVTQISIRSLLKFQEVG